MARPWWMSPDEWMNEQKKKKRRKLTSRQVAGMQRNAALRMSPHELRAKLGADVPSEPPPSLFDDEDEDDDMLDPAECPIYDDMDNDW